MAKQGNPKCSHSPGEAEEWQVGTFCKYNVLLGNIPYTIPMFPPAIDRLPKLTYIGGGGE